MNEWIDDQPDLSNIIYQGKLRTTIPVDVTFCFMASLSITSSVTSVVAAPGEGHSLNASLVEDGLPGKLCIKKIKSDF